MRSFFFFGKPIEKFLRVSVGVHSCPFQCPIFAVIPVSVSVLVPALSFFSSPSYVPAIVSASPVFSSVFAFVAGSVSVSVRNSLSRPFLTSRSGAWARTC